MNSSGAAEIRKHYYLDHYVIIAPKRNLRPDSFTHKGEEHKVANPTCVFCGNDEDVILALPSTNDWQIKVIPNAFPALSLDNPKSYGVQEVIINTPRHDIEFSDLTVSEIELVFEAYRQRLATLKATPGVKYVLIFKNDGPIAGASVAHAHCQVLALPLVPPQINLEHEALNQYRDEHGSCAHCELIGWEESQKVRVIFEDKHVVAIAPYAPDVHFEAWIMPRRHAGTLADLTGSETHSLAVALKKLTARLDSATMSFNYYLQESSPGQDHHFVVKIEPRSIKQLAGAELGTGIIINPVPPEYAALWYNNKAK